MDTCRSAPKLLVVVVYMYTVQCVCIINSTIIMLIILKNHAIYTVIWLQIASNSSCGDNLRIKALYFVSWLARIKPKVWWIIKICASCVPITKFVFIIHYKFCKTLVGFTEYFRYLIVTPILSVVVDCRWYSFFN